MPQIDLKKLTTHRKRTFHLPPAKRLSSPSQALTFINTRGFIYFWPIKGIDLPSLWTTVAGERPVADKHDDPGHITWGWKDDALDKKFWYYGKILRGKATMISLEIAPYFYALSENYGAPEEDYLIAYHEGRLTQASKQVYETLLDNGALNTLDLRKMAKLSNAKDSEFNKALEQYNEISKYCLLAWRRRAHGSILTSTRSFRATILNCPNRRARSPNHRRAQKSLSTILPRWVRHN